MIGALTSTIIRLHESQHKLIAKKFHHDQCRAPQHIEARTLGHSLSRTQHDCFSTPRHFFEPILRLIQIFHPRSTEKSAASTIFRYQYQNLDRLCWIGTFHWIKMNEPTLIAFHLLFQSIPRCVISLPKLSYWTKSSQYFYKRPTSYKNSFPHLADKLQEK